MTPPPPSASRDGRACVVVLIRWLVGAYFVYAGLGKALQPEQFLQLVRLYDIIAGPPALNAIAALLPWLEVFCGGLLVAGIAVRGVAVVLIGMLIPFTAVILQRALALQATEGIAFCAVRFDCGCGTGERHVCGKLAENGLVLVLAGALLRWPRDRACLRFSLVRASNARPRS